MIMGNLHVNMINRRDAENAELFIGYWRRRRQ